MIAVRLKDAFITAAIAAILALPLAGVRTSDGMQGLNISWHLADVGIAAFVVFLGRLALCGYIDWKSKRQQQAPTRVGVALAKISGQLSGNLNRIAMLLLLFVFVFPITPIASRYSLDVAIMVLTYIMMAWGLNITVGYAGLLDLGYAGFYALGAYGYALLAQSTGIGFWTALPVAGLLAAVTALILGFPVLRLRGDYFAVVTLGFGEIVRLVLINWTSLTNGPNGISGVPRPQWFHLEFVREASEGHTSFSDFFGLEYDPVQRVIFLYYIILLQM